jgi:hypothetical protein
MLMFIGNWKEAARARIRVLSTIDLKASIPHCEGLRDAYSNRWASNYNTLIEIYEAELARRASLAEAEADAEALERAQTIDEAAVKRWG